MYLALVFDEGFEYNVIEVYSTAKLAHFEKVNDTFPC